MGGTFVRGGRGVLVQLLALAVLISAFTPVEAEAARPGVRRGPANRGPAVRRGGPARRGPAVRRGGGRRGGARQVRARGRGRRNRGVVALPAGQGNNNQINLNIDDFGPANRNADGAFAFGVGGFDPIRGIRNNQPFDPFQGAVDPSVGQFAQQQPGVPGQGVRILDGTGQRLAVDSQGNVFQVNQAFVKDGQLTDANLGAGLEQKILKTSGGQLLTGEKFNPDSATLAAMRAINEGEVISSPSVGGRQAAGSSSQVGVVSLRRR